MRLQPHVFDAGAAVREAIESLAEPARRDAGISMKVEIGPGSLSCFGDRARLVQVLQNLMRNAIRYTPEGGIILGGAHVDGDQIAITVRDTGLGIPAADVPHIFDRFYRSEQSRNRSHGGAGLGLAIAKQMVEAMGGTIGAESEVGEGTVFRIHLPRASAPATESNGAASGLVRERGPALLPRAKRTRAQDADVRSR
jgi:two-component system sensor histidine kinase BaeS